MSLHEKIKQDTTSISYTRQEIAAMPWNTTHYLMSVGIHGDERFADLTTSERIHLAYVWTKEYLETPYFECTYPTAEEGVDAFLTAKIWPYEGA